MCLANAIAGTHGTLDGSTLIKRSTLYGARGL